jgi:hypothetical protein
MLVCSSQLADDLPGIVGAAIVNKQDFIRIAVGIHDLNNPIVQFAQGFLFVE